MAHAAALEAFALKLLLSGKLAFSLALALAGHNGIWKLAFSFSFALALRLAPTVSRKVSHLATVAALICFRRCPRP